jgi:hypothetical protein
VLLGGLIVSTLLPLVLIPALFSLTMEARSWFIRHRRIKTGVGGFPTVLILAPA